ncbi:MAG TPA: DUF1800 family protein, partial [Actinomycetota bacterium]|nr:DUF1800 family protein [Actinomycetota bacterium]
GHLLNRAAYGPTAGEVERILALGTDAWIDEQLAPESIDESGNTALNTRVNALTETVQRSIDAPIVPSGAVWSYQKGTAAPPANWRMPDYNDSLWPTGPAGFGYGDLDDVTVLDDMLGNYTTVYIRHKFTLTAEDIAAIDNLVFSINYDDGFVAYLNGTEIARRNAPGPAGSFVAFNALATALHEAGAPEVIDVTAQKNVLVAGDNVLAIQTLNDSLSSSDASMIPELLSAGATSGAGCGTILYATGSPVTLSGRANAGDTRSVKVNGIEAQYDPYAASWTATINVALGDNQVVVEAFDGLGRPLDTLGVMVIRISGPFTNVGGTLSANTTWTAAASPYLLTQNVIVPAGVRLGIEPGTYLLGQPGASIIVRGLLEAIGTKDQPIRFRAQNCQSPMGGIAFENTGTGAASPQHRLKFCDLEFLDNPAGFNGAVSPVGSKLLVEDSSFRDLTANGIDGVSARLQVERSLFERIHEGVHCNSSTVIILDSTFSHMVGDSDAIDFDLNGTERSRIERCVLEYSSDDGIDLADATVDIRDNIMRFMSDKALSLEGNGPLGPPTITGNLIHDSGTGIALKNGITIADGHHNTLVGNQEGMNLFAKAGASDGGHGSFDSMIIWNNIFDVKLDQKSTANFTFSDIGALWPGTGNIDLDPDFVDVFQKDYSLSKGSPAIGAGKAGTDMGAIPYSGEPVLFIRGDGNASGAVDVSDAVV